MKQENRPRGFAPNWTTHPGEHLVEHLQAKGLSQAEFARQAGTTPKLVSEIINGKNPVTPETALKLERAFGMRNARAVALSINSPGGAAAQSNLIHRRIRALADEKKIPVFAFVEDVAASGGYMIACAADVQTPAPDTLDMET